jgi:nicotinate phosphoribosyltransferase
MNTRDNRTAEGVLFTDQYQLTMAQLYYLQGIHDAEAQFDHFFRSYPGYDSHKAGYCVNAGLEWLVDWMRESRFGDSDIECLRGQKGRSGRPLFDEGFLTWLKEEHSFQRLTVRAIPEGRVVHPHMPLTVVQGPLGVAQLLETALLNILNYQTLIASKTARIVLSASGGTVLEFGLRRAQATGGNAGTRAALIGGAAFSSNVGMSHILGIPPKGTHAHSMVQAFIAAGGSELDAFRAYADVYPDDCLLLVDTIDTLESGIPNAITVFQELSKAGHQPVGIRLDSGDLAYLSIHAARRLDDAGFSDAIIVLSNQLDELVIWQIISQIRQEAPLHGVDPDKLISRLTYGVGTRLITSTGSPALDGVYKLAALKRDESWKPAIKLSEVPAKTLNPGNKGVFRLYDRDGYAVGDLIAMVDEDPGGSNTIALHDPVQSGVSGSIQTQDLGAVEQLHVPVLDSGRVVHEFPKIEDLRETRARDLDRLRPGVKRIVNPHTYRVSLSDPVWSLKRELIEGVGG